MRCCILASPFQTEEWVGKQKDSALWDSTPLWRASLQLGKDQQLADQIVLLTSWSGKTERSGGKERLAEKSIHSPLPRRCSCLVGPSLSWFLLPAPCLLYLSPSSPLPFKLCINLRSLMSHVDLGVSQPDSTNALISWISLILFGPWMNLMHSPIWESSFLLQANRKWEGDICVPYSQINCKWDVYVALANASFKTYRAKSLVQAQNMVLKSIQMNEDPMEAVFKAYLRFLENYSFICSVLRPK